MSQDVRTFHAKIHPLLERRLFLRHEVVITDDVVDFHSPRSETESAASDQENPINRLARLGMPPVLSTCL